jgi:4-amino-4-deoxy-L-arabinose transferase-like glycosyltransferase
VRRPDADENVLTMAKGVFAAGLMLALLVLARAWLAADLPLTDTTEARYAEISRKMVETSNWVTPQHDYGVPFWGKPPLAFWASAGGIELLGTSELAPRLPILVLSAAFLALFFAWLAPEIGRRAAAFGAIALASSLLFYVSMAAVMTDMVMTICAGAALVAFWRRWRGGGPLSELALYLALGLGLLAKGPLAALLVLGPIGVWSLALRRVGPVWRRFAWLKGALLVAAIALPWYVAAELRTPGFLKYFIVGEHLSRFFVPGWQGDLYTNPHHEPFGTIWIFLAVGLLPWSVLLLPLAFTRRKLVPVNWSEHRDLIVFGLCWAGVPLVLFTAASNIIAPYALPALPGAVAAFMAVFARPGEDAAVRRLAWVGSACLLVPSFWLAAQAHDASFVTRFTQKYLIEAVRSRHPDGCEIRYWQDRYFSAEYYSGGTARHIEDPVTLERDLERTEPVCIVVAANRLESVPAGAGRQLRETLRIGRFAVLEPLPHARADYSEPTTHGEDGTHGEAPADASSSGPQLQPR